VSKAGKTFKAKKPKKNLYQGTRDISK